MARCPKRKRRVVCAHGVSRKRIAYDACFCTLPDGTRGRQLRCPGPASAAPATWPPTISGAGADGLGRWLGWS